MATPVLRALRNDYPEAHIAVWLRPYVAPLYSGLPWFDSIIVHEKSEGGAAIRALRAGRFDLGILLCNSFRSAWGLWRGRVARRVGFGRDMRDFLLTDRLVSMRTGYFGKRLRFPTRESYFAILYHLGVKLVDRDMELRCTPQSIEGAKKFLQSSGIGLDEKLLGIAPGAAWGTAKCWVPERFGLVADRLSREAGMRPVLFCAPGEEPLVEQIENVMETNYVSLRGVSCDLELFKALVARCSLLVSNDSGPRHIAAGMGVPVVVVFGPTQQEMTYIARNREIALQADVPCGPCQLPTCPLDHECMQLISVDDVFEAAVSISRTGDADAVP